MAAQGPELLALGKVVSSLAGILFPALPIAEATLLAGKLMELAGKEVDELSDEELDLFQKAQLELSKA